jgi:GT2 family glycosyltransferase
MLNILVACKEPKTPGGLEYLPGEPLHDWRVIYNSAPNWGNAANQLLDYANAEGGDALFLDDDTTLTETSLEGVHAHYGQADIFGLDLHVLSTGERQAGARHLANMSEWVHPGPAYVAHVSTSAVYIKSTALAVRFPEWDGIHWEDVAYCFRAWLLGLRVMAVPGLVYHDIQEGAGATKRNDPAFWARWGRNKMAFEGWCKERDLSSVPREAVLL